MTAGDVRFFPSSRYRILVKECLETGAPFGILHARDLRAGCLARVARVHEMEADGCSTVQVEGVERFQVVPESLRSDPANFGLLRCHALALPEAPLDPEDAGDSLELAAAELLQARIARLMPLPAAEATQLEWTSGADSAAAAARRQKEKFERIASDPATFAVHYAHWLSARVSREERVGWLEEPSVLGLLGRLNTALSQVQQGPDN